MNSTVRFPGFLRSFGGGFLAVIIFSLFACQQAPKASRPAEQHVEMPSAAPPLKTSPKPAPVAPPGRKAKPKNPSPPQIFEKAISPLPGKHRRRKAKQPHALLMAKKPNPESIQAVDQILTKLDWGNIAYNVPPAMTLGNHKRIELLLSPSLPVQDLQAQLQSQAGAKSATVRVSNRMEAQLTGTGFSIQALNPSLQAVTSQQTTRWAWEVTPTQPGHQELALNLSAYIQISGHDAPLVVRTYDRNIQVQVTLSQRVSGFIAAHGQWLWFVLIVPAAGWLRKRWKKRRGKPKGTNG